MKKTIKNKTACSRIKVPVKAYLLPCLTVAGLAATMQALGTGRILSVKPDTNGVELVIETVPGTTYQVQCRPQLDAGAWDPSGTNFLATASTSSCVVASAETHCFMRVVEMDEIANAPASTPPPPTSPPPLPPGF